MFPIELLRVQISSKKNQIKPVFIDSEKDNQPSLPSNIIKMYEDMADRKLSKSNVDENLSEVEAKNPDYKLVRAICHLLEQRCEYASHESGFSNARNNDTMNAIHLRRQIFEIASLLGYPVTENQRKNILQKVASKNNLSVNDVEMAMWNDLEKNKYLKNFDSLTSLQLVAWYNVSALQTLLLNSVKMEFSIYGGFNWKKILRKIKQLGLMYSLYRESNYGSESNAQTKNEEILLKNKKENKIICTVNGPLSIVRLTDRYGMAMAKLIPSIIFSEIWSINATILRKSISGMKKTYDFELSSTDKDIPLFDASTFHFQSEQKSGPGLSYDNYGMEYFDSSVEKKFMDKFLKFTTGWHLVREPDPLILSNGKAFIPDFVFEKYGVKVYLEIVGFWTEDYLKRKLEKIKDLTSKSETGTSTGPDLLIVANMDNCISENGKKIPIDSVFSKFVSKKHLIFYRKDEIPFGPIISYLKDIDYKVIDEISNNLHDTIALEMDKVIHDRQRNSIISLGEISDKYKIPIESVVKTIRNLQLNTNNSEKVMTDKLSEFLLVDNYMISNDKISELLPELDKIGKLQDAVRLLRQSNIPEECVTLLITKMGYEIIWNGIDSNNAQVQRQTMNT
jgi:predicted nuclease of restriction endonuclease-like RecB superfamily